MSQSATIEYTYATPPTVTSISPKEGSSAGGTEVVIKGSGSSAGAKVTIGGEAKEVVVVSETEITAKTAPGAVGEDEVVVTDGEISSAGGPRFHVPRGAESVAAIFPAEGSTAGGRAVTIKGTGFVTGAKVTIGGEAASRGRGLGHGNHRENGRSRRRESRSHRQ